MKVLCFIATLSLSLSLFAGVPRTPNPQVSPGGLCTTEDRDFKQYRYKERIAYCKRRVSRGLKSRLYDYYGIPKNCRSSYTIDHIIPLSIGGNNKPENLWPEHVSIKATRQNLEYDLYVALKKGKIKQRRAINIILKDKFNPRLPAGFRPSPNCPRLSQVN